MSEFFHELSTDVSIATPRWINLGEVNETSSQGCMRFYELLEKSRNKIDTLVTIFSQNIQFFDEEFSCREDVRRHKFDDDLKESINGGLGARRIRTWTLSPFLNF